MCSSDLTTRAFLERFGLRSIRDLPPLEDFAPDEQSKQFIRERLSGRSLQSTLEEASDDIDDERDLLGDDDGTEDEESLSEATGPEDPTDGDADDE